MATQRIRVEAATPGMKIAQEITLPNGQRLVAAGVVLDDSMIQILRRRAIPTITIELARAAAQNVMSPAEQLRLQHEIQQRLLMRYARVSQNALMVNLFPIFQKVQLAIRQQSC